MLETSILKSIKKVLGVDDTYDVFDQDIVMHINSVFNTLNQLGVGPSSGFMIEDDSAVWSDFTSDDLHFNAIKTYIYMRVRMLFDPPTTGYMVEAMQKQVLEMEWRLTAMFEPGVIVDGGSPSDDGVIIYDGGTP